jgi:hypothetical protein
MKLIFNSRLSGILTIDKITDCNHLMLVLRQNSNWTYTEVDVYDDTDKLVIKLEIEEAGWVPKRYWEPM